MLQRLREALNEIKLYKDDEWHTLHITYHKPIVHRLWRQVGDERLFLHRILPCESDEALWHPHPWPSAMRVVQGTYEMGIAGTHFTFAGEPNRGHPVAKVILTAGSSYEMTNRHAWHYVRPLVEPALSVMIVGKPYETQISFAKPDFEQGPLSASAKADLLNRFRGLLEDGEL